MRATRHRARWAGLLLAAVVTASPCPALAEPALARLVSPADGAELPAGSFFTIEWAPGPGLAALDHVEEWEAFLSLDGGATYPLRITPHLDATIRRFQVRVPDLPTGSARLMLRFGDERREVGFEAPQRLVITGGLRTSIPPARRSLARGERARERDRGVVTWLEGSRRGAELRQVVAIEPPDSIRQARPAALFLLLDGAPVPGRYGLPPPAGAAVHLPPAPRPGTPASSAEPARPADVRLLIHRFNE